MIKSRQTSDSGHKVIRMLSRNFGRSVKGRNQILFLTVILSIITFSLVFGISYGKMQAESVHRVRETGLAASGRIEKGDSMQYASMQSLNYIKSVGRFMEIGDAKLISNSFSNEKNLECQVRWANQDAWEKMFCPAYTEVIGNYPEKEKEILLSRRMLEHMGIAEPKKGMKISMDISLGLFQSVEETFELCGWFQDYERGMPFAYVSQKKVEGWGIPWEEEADLLFSQSEWMSWKETESRLYTDINMRGPGQKISVSNTANYNAVERFLGGYEMALLGVLAVLCGVFFLIHNVMQISMIGEIQKLGLLNTIGATRKQLEQIYYGQIGRIFIGGTGVGVLLSCVILVVFLPEFLEKQYLSEVGGAEGIHFFHPLIIGLSVGFTLGVLLLSAANVIRHIVEMSCVESTKYTGMVKRKQKGCQKKERVTGRKRSEIGELWYLAWRNFLKHKQRMAITILSLFLGIEVFLGMMVIAEGSDYQHIIEQKPDFTIAGEFSAFGKEQGYGEEYQSRDAGEDSFLTEGGNLALLDDNCYDEFSPISSEIRERFLHMEGVNQEQSYIMEGGYLYAVMSAKGIRPMATDHVKKVPDEEMVEGWIPNTIQILEEREIHTLRAYVQSKGLHIDMDAFEDGTGVLILHDHKLSAQQEKMAEESVGESLYFKTMLPKDEILAVRNATTEVKNNQEESEEKKSDEYTLCGYLDRQAEGFPEIRQTWHGAEGNLYFLISEKGFANLPTEKKTLYMELVVAPEEEVAIKEKIGTMVSEENQLRMEQAEAGIFCISKSDLLSEADSYIRANRLILGSISAVLLLAGLTNYANVMVTGVLERKKELEIMESLGMTTKQKRIMIFLECFSVCLFTFLLLLIAGTGILWGIKWYMERKLSYFVFSYPIKWMLLLIGGLSGIAVMVSWMSCKIQRGIQR